MDIEKQVKLAKSTKHIHSTWYRETYPEVAELGLDPVTHFILYGAAMGRNPGKNFNTQFYLDTYPEVRKSKLNPLVHYALYGQKAGYATRPQREVPRKQINVIRTKLLSLGFTERPLAELTEIATSDENPEARAMAARELALWHMRAKTETDYRTALDWIARAHPDVPNTEFRAKLATIEMLCHYHLNDPASGLAAYDKAALAGAATPDLTLARVNFEPSPENRVLWINQVLARYGIEPVTLLPDEGQPAYDRLTCAVDLPKVTDGPKVTVLIAAYDAAEMLPTALRSLQEQTWQNLEVIVLDDCSPTPDTIRVAKEFAAYDPRIQVVQMEQNGGAYVARNRGLDMATGEFVTIHDADDWSHPKKIEMQVRFIMENSDIMGCMSKQARMRTDLCFTRWTGEGRYLINNVSSFMWRKNPVRAQLGYWDTVRFAADSELIRRMVLIFGRAAVVEMDTGPYSFQRDGDTSMVADDVMGMNGFYFGARKEYFDSQRFYHNSGKSMKYTNDKDTRPFPVPALMAPDRERLIAENQGFDVVIAGDFRKDIDSVIAKICDLQAEGKKVGLVEVHDYDLETENIKAMSPDLRAKIDGKKVVSLVFGDACTASQLIGEKVYEERSQRYIATIEIGKSDPDDSPARINFSKAAAQVPSLLAKKYKNDEWKLVSEHEIKGGFGINSDGILLLRLENDDHLEKKVCLKKYRKTKEKPNEVIYFEHMPTWKTLGFKFPTYYGSFELESKYCLAISYVEKEEKSIGGAAKRSSALGTFAQCYYDEKSRELIGLIRNKQRTHKSQSQTTSIKNIVKNNMSDWKQIYRNIELLADYVEDLKENKLLLPALAHGDAQIPNMIMSDDGIPCLIDIGTLKTAPAGYDLAKLCFSYSMPKMSTKRFTTMMNEYVKLYTDGFNIEFERLSPSQTFAGAMVGVYELLEWKFKRLQQNIKRSNDPEVSPEVKLMPALAQIKFLAEVSNQLISKEKDL